MPPCPLWSRSFGNRRHAAGFTLVETAIATVLVGGLLVVAMNMVGASRLTQSRYADRELASVLAQDLMTQILAQPYHDPDGTTGFGVAAGESIALRINLDDSDDFDGYTESPPTDDQGNVLPGLERFTRSVEVDYVRLDSPATISNSDTGVKRMVVTVSLGERQLTHLTAWQTADWPTHDQMSEARP